MMPRWLWRYWSMKHETWKLTRIPKVSRASVKLCSIGSRYLAFLWVTSKVNAITYSHYLEQFPSALRYFNIYKKTKQLTRIEKCQALEALCTIRYWRYSVWSFFSGGQPDKIKLLVTYHELLSISTFLLRKSTQLVSLDSGRVIMRVRQSPDLSTNRKHSRVYYALRDRRNLSSRLIKTHIA